MRTGKSPTAEIRTFICRDIKPFDYISSESDNENKSVSARKRRVTFQSTDNKPDSNVKHRLLSTNRSFEERITFTGRHTIYTAGILMHSIRLNIRFFPKDDRHGMMHLVKLKKHS